jgi:predicted nucleic acid-binding protein
MRIVLDTSAAIRIARRDSGYERLKEAVEKAEWVEAPELFVAEATNVCWKYHVLGHLSLEHAETALDETISMVDEFVPCATLYREAFAMAVRGQKAAYDMFYLALARRNNASLLSADAKLLAFAAKHDVKVFEA